MTTTPSYKKRPSATIENSDSDMWTWHFIWDKRLFCVCSDPLNGEASIIPRHPYEIDGTEIERPDFLDAIQKMVSFRVTGLELETIEDKSGDFLVVNAKGEPRPPVRHPIVHKEQNTEPKHEPIKRQTSLLDM